jgi:hypothetical protein
VNGGAGGGPGGLAMAAEKQATANTAAMNLDSCFMSTPTLWVEKHKRYQQRRSDNNVLQTQSVDLFWRNIFMIHARVAVIELQIASAWIFGNSRVILRC